jgi:hypothetical protein
MADPVRTPDPKQPHDELVEDDPNDVENAWAKEIERRRREIHEGAVAPVPGEDVLRRLRAWRPTNAE